jgi:hypothetical protein
MDDLLVLAVVAIGRQVNVIDPHLTGRLDANRIASLREDLADFDVTDNDIRYVQNPDADPAQS